MAKLSTQEIVDAIKEMTILEVKDLEEAIEKEFGVNPNAVAVAAPAEAQKDDGPSTKTVVLKSCGDKKIAVIKVIREATGLGLVEAKGLADKGGNIKENIPAAEADELKAKLEEAGATVELQ